jgi:ribosomal-protein-alanine N-acetyltransferase
MRPDLVGRGLGAGFLSEILDHGQYSYDPNIFRATIASFNQRSLRTFQSQGFMITGRFVRELSDLEFYQLEKQVKEK